MIQAVDEFGPRLGYEVHLKGRCGLNLKRKSGLYQNLPSFRLECYRQPLPVPQESHPGPERLREVGRPVHPGAEHGVAGLLLGEGPRTVRGGRR